MIGVKIQKCRAVCLLKITSPRLIIDSNENLKKKYELLKKTYFPLIFPTLQFPSVEP